MVCSSMNGTADAIPYDALPEPLVCTHHVQAEPDEKRAPDQVPVRHKTPDPAIAAVVPVVAHHEIVTRRHGADHVSLIVVAIFTERELLSAVRVWPVRGTENIVSHAVEIFR